MKIKLFNKNIEPACQYCEHGRNDSKNNNIICKKHGKVSPYFSCRSFQYAPLKRIPKRISVLPQYSKEDFKL